VLEIEESILDGLRREVREETDRVERHGAVRGRISQCTYTG